MDRMSRIRRETPAFVGRSSHAVPVDARSRTTATTPARLILLACLPLLVGGCSSEQSKAEPEPATFSAKGSVVLTMAFAGDTVAGGTAYCNERFANVTQTQVLIKNPAGTVVGYGTLLAPNYRPMTGTCVAQWHATGLPTGEVLSYQIGNLKPIYFKQADARRLLLSIPDGGYAHPVG